MPKLTKRHVEGLKPGDRELFEWDDELPGFGVRIKPSGIRSYFVQYRNRDGRSRRITLGRHGILKVADAREKALQTLAAIGRGEDPAGEREEARKAPTVSELCDRYLREHVERFNRPSTAKEFTRIVEKRIKPELGSLKAHSVTRQDIIRLHSKLNNTPREANHALAVMSKMLNLAELWGLRPENSNPCRLVKRYQETKRERFLTDAELVRLGEVLERCEQDGTELPGVINAIRLLALTGCRLGEILNLKWDHVDLDNGFLNLIDAKAGTRLHVIGAPARALLAALPRVEGSPWVVHGTVPGAQLSPNTLEAAWRRIRDRAGLIDVRLHDLRHTVGTYAGQTGANAFLVRDKLGHKTLAMTGRYVSRDADPLRALSDQVEERIEKAMRAGARGNVIPFDQSG